MYNTKAIQKIQNWWIEAQLKGKTEFTVHMKNGSNYNVKHFNISPLNPTWGSFSIFHGNKLICNEISNVNDLTEILIKIGKNKLI